MDTPEDLIAYHLVGAKTYSTLKDNYKEGVKYHCTPDAWESLKTRENPTNGVLLFDLWQEPVATMEAQEDLDDGTLDTGLGGTSTDLDDLDTPVIQEGAESSGDPTHTSTAQGSTTASQPRSQGSRTIRLPGAQPVKV